MGIHNRVIKWSRGKSRVVRATLRTKSIIAIKEKAMHTPIKLLNQLMQRKK